MTCTSVYVPAPRYMLGGCAGHESMAVWRGAATTFDGQLDSDT